MDIKPKELNIVHLDESLPKLAGKLCVLICQLYSV